MIVQTCRSAVDASMAGSINRELISINPQLLPPPGAPGHHQPMVETMAKRLRQLVKREGLSLEKFGDLAGVSATSAHKWLNGGDVKEANVKKLAAHFGVTPAWIRYGQQAAIEAHEAVDKYSPGLPATAIEVATRWMTLSTERQDALREIIFTMSYIESKFPSMRRSRPSGESYDSIETAFEKDLKRAARRSETVE
jgi:transcriptional regulator with XRE-family HTH domain